LVINEEVGFLVTKNANPLFIIEAKLNEKNEFAQMSLCIPVSDKRVQLESVKTSVQAHPGGDFRNKKGCSKRS
jgi:hypothetical protein